MNGSKEPIDKLGLEEAGGSAAKIDGVYDFGKVRADVFAPLTGVAHLSDEALHVSRVFMRGEHAGRKVAVSTLRPTERDGDIKAELVVMGYCHSLILSCPKERRDWLAGGAGK